MNLNTIIALTSLALGVGIQASTSALDFKGSKDRLQGVTDGATMAALIQKYHTATGSYYFLKHLDAKNLEFLASVSGGITTLAASLKYLNPKALSAANLDQTNLNALFSSPTSPLPVSFVNDLSNPFIAKNGIFIIKKLGGRVSKLKDKAVKTLLASKEGVETLTFGQFFKLIEKPKFATMFTPKSFNWLNGPGILQANIQTAQGILISNLPDNIFSLLEHPLNDGWFRFMSESQMRNFEAKIKDKDAPSLLKLASVGPQAVPGIGPNVLSRYLNSLSSPESAQMKRTKFWKRLQTGVFSKVLKNDQDGTIVSLIPKKAFTFMTKEQRQAILDAMGREGACSAVPVHILAGKAKEIAGLNVSRKCFESAREGTDVTNSRQFRFRSLLIGATEAESAKDLDVDEIDKLATNFKRGKKDPIVLTRMCSFEVFAKNKLGAEYMKNILKDDVEDKCHSIEIGQLCKAHWVQSKLTPECIRSISEDFDGESTKKMHANMWAGFGWKQVKVIVRARTSQNGKWVGLSDAAYEGLSRNDEFATKAFVRKTKTEEGDDQEEVEMLKVPIITKLPAEQVKKHFGADFVKHVPTEHNEILADNIGLLADSALSGSTATFIRTSLNAEKITDGQFGRASDSVDAALSYPASLTVAEMQGMSASRVAAFSATFMSRLKPSVIAIMSTEQVAALQPASLVSVCGESASAFKSLSDAQKAELGSKCPSGPNAAPCPFSASSILALTAAAAGSAALLL